MDSADEKVVAVILVAGPSTGANFLILLIIKQLCFEFKNSFPLFLGDSAQVLDLGRFLSTHQSLYFLWLVSQWFITTSPPAKGYISVILEEKDYLWLMLYFIWLVWECGDFLTGLKVELCRSCIVLFCIWHFILQCIMLRIRVVLWLMVGSVQIPNLVQVFLIGYYDEREFALYSSSVSNELKVPVRWIWTMLFLEMWFCLSSFTCFWRFSVI